MPDSDIREQTVSSNDPAQIILLSMAEAETKAWEALSGYKFWMFGYHAARWVNYNQLLPRQRRFRNPFASLVKIGREYADGAQEELPVMELDPQLTLFNGAAAIQTLPKNEE